MTGDRAMRTAEEEFRAKYIAWDDSDETIANKVADYLVGMFPRSKTYHLSISHDVRPDAVRQLARMRKRYPTYQHDGHARPVLRATTGPSETSSASRREIKKRRGNGRSRRRSQLMPYSVDSPDRALGTGAGRSRTSGMAGGCAHERS